MKLEKLLEQTQEGEWIVLETNSEEKYSGKLDEVEREYTKRKRKWLKRIKEELGRPAAENSSELMEAEGEIIKYRLENPSEDYSITVNPMQGITHATKKRDEYLTEEINYKDSYKKEQKPQPIPAD